MRLISFTVKDYRSITKAYKLPVHQLTTLIGPNNEGKSNLVRALVVALQAIQSVRVVKVADKDVYTHSYSGSGYSWERDYPIATQAINQKGKSIFTLEFELTPKDIEQFRTEIKSSINTVLPIEISLSHGGRPVFKIPKQGKGGKSLTDKALQIAQYISNRIDVQHIPAVRTADHAVSVVEDMVAQALSGLESNPEYQKAMLAIQKLQRPLLQNISTEIRSTLQDFLPQINTVEVRIPETRRRNALRRAIEVVVDDGTPTELAYKGDGVQSIAALGLMKYSSTTNSSGKSLVLAIEEPESHLHPKAINSLKKVIEGIAADSQVIITTHCPLFVNRRSIDSNIIVGNGKASPAQNIQEIRDILGVRAADNLQHAETVLIVEGEEDRIALHAILRYESKVICQALDSGRMCIDTLLGGGNLSYKLTSTREALCEAYCILDNDSAGLNSVGKATAANLIDSKNVTFVTVDGLNESELEDLYDLDFYKSLLKDQYSVYLPSPKFKGKDKWSERMGRAFQNQGKAWSKEIKMIVKGKIATLVANDPANAINKKNRGSLDAIIRDLENLLA